MADKPVPKLIVLSSQLRGKQFELINDLYTIGRVDDRDITIKDSSISSHHCDLIKDGDSYLLRDNDSTNGTRVNNIKIHEKKLQNSDILQLGSVEVLYDAKETASSSSSSIGKTVTGITISDITQTELLQKAAVTEEKKSKFDAQKLTICAAGILAALIIGLILLSIIF